MCFFFLDGGTRFAIKTIGFLNFFVSVFSTNLQVTSSASYYNDILFFCERVGGM